MSYIKTYYEGSRYEYKFYYKDKKYMIIHREDGPAVECKDGRKRYYLNGKEYEEQEYWAIIKLGVFI